MVPARSSQTWNSGVSGELVPAGPAGRPPAVPGDRPAEIAGGLLSPASPSPPVVPPNFTPHAPATYRLGFVSGQCWRVMW